MPRLPVDGFPLTSYLCDQSKNPNCGGFPEALILGSNTFAASTLTLDISYLANGQTFNFTASQPNTVTPEPSSFLLLGTGLAGAVGFVRRRLTRSAGV